MEAFKGLLRVKGFSLAALFDEKGRLLHLCFGKQPAPRVLRRLERYFPGVLIREAPLSWCLCLQSLLEAYFEGRQHNLSFPLFIWGSTFEKRVWEIVSQIPYGEVRTYGWVAQKLGKIQASRAVGRALASNPLPIFIPCHRIVARQGLGGFSQGLEIKIFLLELEKTFRQ